jgi:hypothetical protein
MNSKIERIDTLPKEWVIAKGFSNFAMFEHVLTTDEVKRLSLAGEK